MLTKIEAGQDKKTGTRILTLVRPTNIEVARQSKESYTKYKLGTNLYVGYYLDLAEMREKGLSTQERRYALERLGLTTQDIKSGNPIVPVSSLYLHALFGEALTAYIREKSNFPNSLFLVISQERDYFSTFSDLHKGPPRLHNRFADGHQLEQPVTIWAIRTEGQPFAIGQSPDSSNPGNPNPKILAVKNGTGKQIFPPKITLVPPAA